MAFFVRTGTGGLQPLTLTRGDVQLARVEASGSGWDPVAAILNAAADGELRVRAAVEQARDLDGDFGIRPAPATPENAEVHLSWSRAMGGDTGPLCLVEANGATSLPVPRTALAGWLLQLDEVQREHDRVTAARRQRAKRIARWSEPEPPTAIDPAWADLEAQARAIDAEPNDAARDALLTALHDAGLLTIHAALRLEEAGHDTLYDIAIAAHDLRMYLASEERRAATGLEAEPVLASPVSLDWFRLGPYGRFGLTPHAYLAELEGLMNLNPPSGPSAIWSTGMGTDTLRFQQQHGRWVLLAGSLRCLPDGTIFSPTVETDALHPDVQLETLALQLPDPIAKATLLAWLLRRAPARSEARHALTDAWTTITGHPDPDLSPDAVEAAAPCDADQLYAAVATTEQGVRVLAEQPDLRVAPLLARALHDRTTERFTLNYVLKRLGPFLEHPEIKPAVAALIRRGVDTPYLTPVMQRLGLDPSPPPKAEDDGIGLAIALLVVMAALVGAALMFEMPLGLP